MTGLVATTLRAGAEEWNDLDAEARAPLRRAFLSMAEREEGVAGDEEDAEGSDVEAASTRKRHDGPGSARAGRKPSTAESMANHSRVISERFSFSQASTRPRYPSRFARQLFDDRTKLTHTGMGHIILRQGLVHNAQRAWWFLHLRYGA